MKKMNVMAIAMLVVFGASAFAVGYLGAPTAEIGQGKWSLGYDYSYSSQDTDKVNARYDLIGVDAGPFKFNMKDFNLHRHYATIGYGLTEDWDIYAKLGFTDLKAQAKDYDINDQWGINFDTDFAWGWGTRYTFARQDNIAWGVALQMNWLDTESTWKAGTRKGVYAIDSYDLLVSAGPTIDLSGWKLYGGPFYYYLSGDYDYKVKNAGVLEYIEKADIEESRNFGVFLGSIVNLSQNCNWSFEYATTGKGWGIGTGIAWSF